MKVAAYYPDDGDRRHSCGVDCIRTGRCQRQELQMFERQYHRLRHRQKYQGTGCLPPEVHKVLRRLYRQMNVRPGSDHQSDVGHLYDRIKNRTPYLRDYPDEGRWLVEVAYYACHSCGYLEEGEQIPGDILGRAMDIASVNTGMWPDFTSANGGVPPMTDDLSAEAMEAVEATCRYLEEHPEERGRFRKFLLRLLGPHLNEVLHSVNDRKSQTKKGHLA